MLVNDGGETSREGPHDLGTLFGAVGEAGEGGMPHRQSTLSDATGEADVEKGEVIHPIVGEASRSREGI